MNIPLVLDEKHSACDYFLLLVSGEHSVPTCFQECDITTEVWTLWQLDIAVKTNKTEKVGFEHSAPWISSTLHRHEGFYYQLSAVQLVNASTENQ